MGLLLKNATQGGSMKKVNNDNKKFEEYMEKSVAPDPSRTYDGQNLTVMQGIMGQKYDKNADRSSSIWKSVKLVLIIGVCVLCTIMVFYAMIIK